MKYTTYGCTNYYNTHLTYTSVPHIIVKGDETPEAFRWGKINDNWFCEDCIEKIDAEYQHQLIVSKL